MIWIKIWDSVLCKFIPKLVTRAYANSLPHVTKVPGLCLKPLIPFLPFLPIVPIVPLIPFLPPLSGNFTPPISSYPPPNMENQLPPSQIIQGTIPGTGFSIPPATEFLPSPGLSILPPTEEFMKVPLIPEQEKKEEVPEPSSILLLLTCIFLLTSLKLSSTLHKLTKRRPQV